MRYVSDLGGRMEMESAHQRVTRLLLDRDIERLLPMVKWSAM